MRSLTNIMQEWEQHNDEIQRVLFGGKLLLQDLGQRIRANSPVSTVSIENCSRFPFIVYKHDVRHEYSQNTVNVRDKRHRFFSVEVIRGYTWLVPRRHPSCFVYASPVPSVVSVEPSARSTSWALNGIQRHCRRLQSISLPFTTAAPRLRGQLAPLTRTFRGEMLLKLRRTTPISSRFMSAKGTPKLSICAFAGTLLS